MYLYNITQVASKSEIKKWYLFKNIFDNLLMQEKNKLRWSIGLNHFFNKLLKSLRFSATRNY